MAPEIGSEAPEIGTMAPDFTLMDQNGQDVTLSSFRGERNVLLIFYPFTFSGICTSELCWLRDDLPNFQNDTVQVLAVSVDHPFALRAWANQQGYTFPLLSDFWPHGKAAQAYGVFDAGRGMAVRGTFLIDWIGDVRFTEINTPGEHRDIEGWKKAISELEG